MSTHVSFQMIRSTKTLLAHIAFVRFLVRVNAHVLFQTTRITKTLLAHIAFVRFLVRVNTHVAFQTTRLSKTSSRTHHIRTVSRSCEYACAFSNHQIDEKLSRTHHIRTVSRSCEYACGFSNARLSKTSLAHITFIRFLVRVNTHVGFQITRLTKTLSRTHHIRTVSRSCAYACVWPIWMDIETPSRTHRTRVALSFSSLL